MVKASSRTVFDCKLKKLVQRLIWVPREQRCGCVCLPSESALLGNFSELLRPFLRNRHSCCILEASLKMNYYFLPSARAIDHDFSHFTFPLRVLPVPIKFQLSHFGMDQNEERFSRKININNNH